MRRMANKVGPSVQEIATYLVSNPTATEDDVEDWCSDLGYDDDTVLNIITRMAVIYSQFLLGGLSVKKDMDDNLVDADELKRGIEVEMEHTTDPETAKRIALDHLAELKNYYTLLDKMESSPDAVKA